MMRLILLPLLLIFASCATYRPVVDPASISNDDSFYSDIAECQALAKSNNDMAKEAVKGGVVGGGVGAGTGALLGSISDSAGSGAAYGAVIGGVAGLLGGITQGERVYEQIYRNCMFGRGYSVLN